jgi:cytochrome c oxidase cbb3-type subunit 3
MHVMKSKTLALVYALVTGVAVGGSATQAFVPDAQQPPAAPQAPRIQGGPNFPQQQRPPGDPAVIARGRGLYGVACTGCHGPDLRGGDQGGPNLLRSEIVLTDEKGEKIGAVIRSGRQGSIGAMPASNLPEADVLAIAEYIHSVMGQAGRQGRPPEREQPWQLNVLVGDAASGQVYFSRACGKCHSPGGDLQGIATRAGDARALQNLWVSGGVSSSGPGGGGGGRGGDSRERRVTVTVTQPGSAPITGRLVRMDDFIVTLVQEDGLRRTIARTGAMPKIEIADPLEPHRRLVLELTDRDMHNVTAYLATLK